MSAQIAAGAESTKAVAASAFRRLSIHRSLARRRPQQPLAERVLQGIGRTFFDFTATRWLLIDSAILAVGFQLGFIVFPPPEGLADPHLQLWQAIAVYAFSAAVASLVFGLYERDTLMSRSRIFTRILLTALTLTLIAYAVIVVLMYSTLQRKTTTLALSLFLVGGTGIRLFAWWTIHRVRRGLLVVGTRALYDSFAAAQKCGALHEYRLIGYCTPGYEASQSPRDRDCLGCIDEQIEKLGQQRVTDIVVGKSAARDPSLMDWMVASLRQGCRVTNEATFYETAAGEVLVDEITPQWFLFADLKVHCDQQATLKRAVDVVIATVGLALTLPIWPVIALAVKFCDGGPVFYSQERVGQNGRLFRLYKFRTMRVNAENGRSVWSSPNDPRVTHVGRFLRHSRLDELPQLFNVLVGQMSVVGPRPERPDFVRDLCEKLPYYAERHLVKPGITGWAQISYRYGSSVDDARRKLQFDLYYLKRMCFELDMMILFRTLGTFLRGAR
ncbi:MAG: exopolysaccharide biosynthesis polyprenyl glycosylphosphotransferase [Phycisphaerae bacterium]|nr:exopolysaccharide biosynthesis polyprenyl glycosylphosphotransferase [Phycisphaerae bacterium]